MEGQRKGGSLTGNASLNVKIGSFIWLLLNRLKDLFLVVRGQVLSKLSL